MDSRDSRGAQEPPFSWPSSRAKRTISTTVLSSYEDFIRAYGIVERKTFLVLKHFRFNGVYPYVEEVDWPLLYAAQVFQLTRLTTFCERVLFLRMEARDSFTYLVRAEIYEAQLLKRSILKYLVCYRHHIGRLLGWQPLMNYDLLWREFELEARCADSSYEKTYQRFINAWIVDFSSETPPDNVVFLSSSTPEDVEPDHHPFIVTYNEHKKCQSSETLPQNRSHSEPIPGMSKSPEDPTVDDATLGQVLGSCLKGDEPGLFMDKAPNGSAHSHPQKQAFAENTSQQLESDHAKPFSSAELYLCQICHRPERSVPSVGESGIPSHCGVTTKTTFRAFQSSEREGPIPCSMTPSEINLLLKMSGFFSVPISPCEDLCTCKVTMFARPSNSLPSKSLNSGMPDPAKKRSFIFDLQKMANPEHRRQFRHVVIDASSAPATINNEMSGSDLLQVTKASALRFLADTNSPRYAYSDSMPDSPSSYHPYRKVINGTGASLCPSGFGGPIAHSTRTASCASQPSSAVPMHLHHANGSLMQSHNPLRQPVIHPAISGGSFAPSMSNIDQDRVPAVSEEQTLTYSTVEDLSPQIVDQQMEQEHESIEQTVANLELTTEEECSLRLFVEALQGMQESSLLVSAPGAEV